MRVSARYRGPRTPHMMAPFSLVSLGASPVGTVRCGTGSVVFNYTSPTPQIPDDEHGIHQQDFKRDAILVFVVFVFQFLSHQGSPPPEPKPDNPSARSRLRAFSSGLCHMSELLSTGRIQISIDGQLLSLHEPSSVQRSTPSIPELLPK